MTKWLALGGLAVLVLALGRVLAVGRKTQPTLTERATFRQFLCGLRGHDSVLHFEGPRVNMRCTSCGHDTPGWVL